MATPLHFIGISGSLRRASVNRAALVAAQKILPEGVELELVEIGDLPHYNGDDDVPPGPAPVQRLKQQIASADGIVIATPEYNYGIPGVLKNALDWASRPAYRSVLAQKPVALFGVSPGMSGAMRAQGQLKQVLLSTVSLVFPYPEVAIASANEKIADGEFKDERTREIVRGLLAGFAEFARKFPRART